MTAHQPTERTIMNIVKRDSTPKRWVDVPDHKDIIETYMARLCRDNGQAPVTTQDLAKHLTRLFTLTDVRSSLRRALDKEMEGMVSILRYRKRGY